MKWGPLIVGDVVDRHRLDEVILKYGPCAVMHFAAAAYVGESVVDPGKYSRNNVSGTLILLEAMRDHTINKMVFSSTCAVYGEPERSPISEEHPLNPINPYGMSKRMVEQMLEDFGRAYSLKSVALRYFNAAGADIEGEIGETHDPETHLIPLVLDAAAGRSPEITIFGDDYPTTDGTCIRDYIHVTDLAKAHILALERLMGMESESMSKRGDKSLQVYNLGNGLGASVRQVIKTA